MCGVDSTVLRRSVSIGSCCVLLCVVGWSCRANLGLCDDVIMHMYWKDERRGVSVLGGRYDHLDTTVVRRSASAMYLLCIIV